MKTQKTGLTKRLKRKNLIKAEEKQKQLQKGPQQQALALKKGKFYQKYPEIRIPKPKTVDVNTLQVTPELAHVLMNEASTISKDLLYGTEEDFSNSIFGITQEDEALKHRIANQVDRANREISNKITKHLNKMSLEQLHVICKRYHEHAKERMRKLSETTVLIPVKSGTHTTTSAESNVNDTIIYSIQSKDALLFGSLLKETDTEIIKEAVLSQTTNRIMSVCLIQNPIERTSRLNQFSEYERFMKEEEIFIRNVRNLNNEQIKQVMESDIYQYNKLCHEQENGIVGGLNDDIQC